MRSKGWFVQRIESGETGKGIPDIYSISPAHNAIWMELKRVHACIGRNKVVEIPWRPGQIAWLSGVCARGQKAVTVAAFDDGILMIPHNVLWRSNQVAVEACIYCKGIKELLA